MSIDISNLKFIPEEEVPYKKETKWDAIFSAIPKGQAVVIPEELANADSVRGALQRRQQLGKFKNLRIISRGARGKRKTYIVNPADTDKTTERTIKTRTT